MKKKNLGLLSTVALMTIMMTACGSDNTPSTEVSTETVSSEEISTKESTESTEDISVEDPNVNIEDPGVVIEPTEEVDDTTEIVEDEVPTVPSDETIDKIFTDVRTKLGDNYFPNMPIDALFLQDMYGIDLANVEAAYGEMPMISANVDTFIAIKAVEGQVDAVKNGLEAYLTSQKEDAFQYPINLPVIQNAEVYVKGNYVFYICLAGDTMAAAGQGDEAIANQTKQTVADVKTVIDAIIDAVITE